MLSLVYNPYAGQDFFHFFSVAIHRWFLWICQGSLEGIVSDEIQYMTIILLGIPLSLLGSFLVVRQMTMLANALSHTLLVGIVLAFLGVQFFLGEKMFAEPFSSMKILWPAALATGMITTLSVELLTRVFRVQEDASIGLVFTTLFAVGIFLVTICTRNVHLGMEAIMGNMDALHKKDLYSVAIYAGISLVLYAVLFRGFFFIAFDPCFAKTVGLPTVALDRILMLLTAAGAIASFRAVGVLLFLSLLVGPVLIARVYSCHLKKIIFLSFAITAITGIFSVALSRHILTVWDVPLSTSGILSSILGLVYLLSLVGVAYKKKSISF